MDGENGNARTEVLENKSGLEREIYCKGNIDKARKITENLAQMPCAFFQAYEAGLMDWRNAATRKTASLVLWEIIRCTSQSKTITGMRTQGYMLGFNGADVWQAHQHYQKFVEYYLKKYGATP